MRKVKRALISVSDKTGLEELVKVLNEFKVEMLSTGGTAKLIAGMGIPVKSVSDHTGFPEMLDGRVKTLHPKIHGGLLAIRDKKEHMEQVKKHDIGLIDMVVVNLYPFEKTIAKPGVKLEEAIENIDIGGPSMLRSAAKNSKDVVVVCNPHRYKDIIKELKENDGSISDKLHFKLGVEVFEKTSKYDTAIYDYLKKQIEGEGSKVEGEGNFPDALELKFEKVQSLRYGENPHQKASFYKDKSINVIGISNAKQLHGKELSFNNIIDLDAALEIVKEFKEPAASVIKHTNPCGAAVAKTLADAYRDALECDKISAFGSIVGLNGEVDFKTAEAIISAGFTECIIAPSYEKKALDILMGKKNLRLIEVGGLKGIEKDYDLKKVVGGLLIQDRDIFNVEEKDLKVVTNKIPAKDEIESLLFGWKIAKHVKSNAIVLSQGTRTVGVGAGQMSRVDSMVIAIMKSRGLSKGSTCASDAFFPKEDAIEEAKKAGITSIIQPGGSIRDEHVIKTCDDAGISMVLTGARHFKH
ncbi:MAG: bifunctional phosphoribosylaminoimidazolecarboxamide formyltransferase/inosine monophosphate cyclohydrolase [Candidatus Omnitrophica bacterium CG_4_9_14_0_2_um_filter_42_8]|nr:MAG: bifunctional phosphoribosylaminoimidazolecarboxamide formyltransferase/inosine monophosphate cyclohydrolase [Candidatus Omnitrophica bacterium CG22_combo_CG10-13_8_21_14_all_43_16]PJC48340.1 MAG: bifunctional phosphoribosylaminoimidazolecarboxamide formyltransferase/inosine monophosphate cyclohydrolase [Candidatus Omnitrophica bacterium CG_4_9_14_0_2_um_filter_42_8]